MNDMYGIEREQQIRKSGVREIFTPNKPIDAVELFFGRANVVKSVIESLNTPGQHLLLYGDRGVGKSSLANVTVIILKKNKFIDGDLIIRRCSSQDTFESLSEKLLKDFDKNYGLLEKTVVTKDKGDVSAKMFGMGGSVGAESSTSKKIRCSFELTPSNMADYLKDKRGLFLIDEFDTLKNDTDKKNISELIKLLSDYNSPFKIFVVGIAQSGTELTAGHPSVVRCLKEIKLERMNRQEIREIVVNGMHKINVEVSDQVISIIENISNGYPYFSHLIGLKCAEEAITKQIRKITKPEFIVAIDNSVKDAEGTLKRLYDNATQNASDTKRRNIQIILKCCSDCNHEDFTIGDVFIKLEECGAELSNKTISGYVGQFTSESGDSIFRRIRRGVYRFSDPRMPSYIKMIENVLERDISKIEYGKF